MTNKCSLCNLEAKYYQTDRDGSIYDCPRCGRVEISGILEAIFLNNPDYDNRKPILSGITRYRTENNLKPIVLLSDNYDYLKDEYYVPRDISQKIELLLKYIAKKSDYAGNDVRIDVKLDYPITFSPNEKELNFILNQLLSKGLLLSSLSQIGHIYKLSVDGWNRIDDLLNKTFKKKQAFIAMWFKDELSKIYENGFRKAIIDSGYEPMRIDMKEHNNKIDDEIIAEIRNSAFLIADFTGQRGGVYFEAGFAMGLGIPVIWSCQYDEFENLHFDTRQFNHINWKDEQELYTKLTNRIKATIIK